jgi:hypothetical protein
MTTVCFAALGLIFLYQAFLAVACLHPTLRRKLIDSTEIRGVMSPVPTPEARYYKAYYRAYRGYKTSAQYDHQHIGV